MRSIFPVGDVLKDDELLSKLFISITTTMICGPPMMKKTALLMQVSILNILTNSQMAGKCTPFLPHSQRIYNR